MRFPPLPHTLGSRNPLFPKSDPDAQLEESLDSFTAFCSHFPLVLHSSVLLDKVVIKLITLFLCQLVTGNVHIPTLGNKLFCCSFPHWFKSPFTVSVLPFLAIDGDEEFHLSFSPAIA